MVSTAYASGFGPAKKIQTFSSLEDRERLTPSALVGMRKLAAEWGVTGEQMAALLAVSPSTWDRMAAGTWTQAFNQDQMTRVSALVGIFKGLHLLFAADAEGGSMADRWPRLHNEGPLFAGKSPIEAMIEGGIPVMIEVRRYVDALRGGL